MNNGGPVVQLDLFSLESMGIYKPSFVLEEAVLATLDEAQFKSEEWTGSLKTGKSREEVGPVEN